MRSFLIFLLCIFLSSCFGGNGKNSDGGFYGGDRPPSNDRDFSKIPDAVPKLESLSKYGNKPYEVLGKNYKPLASSHGFSQTGVASWYGKKFHGRRTSSGEIYDIWKMTAAHTTLPLPTYVRVTSLEWGNSIIVKVNDRGPFLHNRIIDLSYAAAHKLGIAKAGTGKVSIEAIDPRTYTKQSNNDSNSTIQSGYVGGDPHYFVQIGVYGSQENTKTMRSNLTNLGYAIFPISESVQFSQSPPYKVQIGPFLEMDSALEATKLLEERFGHKILLLVK
jgi:rare lipoprotein A